MVRSGLKKVLVISHSASRSGAPLVLLKLLKAIKHQAPEISFDILFLEDGELMDDFSEICNQTFTPFTRNKKSFFKKGTDFLRARILGVNLEEQFTEHYFKNIVNNRYDLIFYNTIEALRLWDISNTNLFSGTNSLLYLHESVHYYCAKNSSLPERLKKIDIIVSISQRVKKQLLECIDIANENIKVIYSSSIEEDSILESKKAGSDKLRVFGSGIGHYRKGFDWFFQLAVRVRQKYPSTKISWTWIGWVDDLTQYFALQDANELGIELELVGQTDKPMEEYSQRDLLVLTAREEPLSLVAIECASIGIPVMYFKDKTGFEELDENKDELAFEYGDLDLMADKIYQLAENRQLLREFGQNNIDKAGQYTVTAMAKAFISCMYEEQ
jgi:glycosyltransferase involved in cell wall biosynthesis